MKHLFTHSLLPAVVILSLFFPGVPGVLAQDTTPSETPTPTPDTIELPATTQEHLVPLFEVDPPPQGVQEEPTVAQAQASALTVLYDQMDYPMEPPLSGASSQNFETDQDQYDGQVADDFVIPAAMAGWAIEMVEVVGFYVGGGTRSATSVNVWFYADAGGLPGAKVYAATAVVPSDGLSSGSFVMDLNPVAMLAPGTYWVSVQANLDFSPEGRQWAWRKRTVQGGFEAAFRNPGDGFGTGCINWGARVTTCGGHPAGADMLFRLMGTSRPISIEITDAQDSSVSALSLNADGWPTPNPLIVKVTLTCPAGGPDCNYYPFSLDIGFSSGAGRFYLYDASLRPDGSNCYGDYVAVQPSYQTFTLSCNSISLYAGDTISHTWNLWVQPSAVTTSTMLD